ncbi:kinase-like protein [Dentipellis sp. KUC8613]|nr:kinase-like protein [Dentipellis sp. KUC8613]
MASQIDHSPSPRTIRRSKSLLPYSPSQSFCSAAGTAAIRPLPPVPQPPPIPFPPPSYAQSQSLRPLPSLNTGPPKLSLKILTSDAVSTSSGTSSQSHSDYGSTDSFPDDFGSRMPPPEYHPNEDFNMGTTIRPANTRAMKRPLSMKDLRRTINDIALRTPALEPSKFDSHDVRDGYPHTEWSDDVFEVGGRLGEGIGGAVYQVKDTRTGIVMARKTIATHEAPMKQLIRELSLINMVSHTNIIRFYGAYISPSSSEVKVVMELCEGKSLEAIGERIKKGKGRVGEKVAGRIAEGVLQGLAYLHSKRLIHRDIKPSNILMSRKGTVKLCDFGVSGELVESHADTFTGTRVYMAPERITGHEYSIRADVWSTGLSILELAQNRFPFPRDLSVIDLVVHVSQSEPPRLEDEPPVHWSDEMKDFIRASLMCNPASRPTPREMLQHPWITKVMRHRVDMAQWIAEVWRWNTSKSQGSKENVSCAAS